jgi:hypothetical protein
MTDPVSFDSTSARFTLPLLFVGQAQKEAYVNEALSRLDGLLFCAIESEAATPPVSPADGQAWLVGASPGGDWAGRAGQIAIRQSGQWLYAAAVDGMRLLNRSTGQDIRRAGATWRAPSVPAAPSGGAVVDAEARTAVSAIVAALRQAGVFPL